MKILIILLAFAGCAFVCLEIWGRRSHRHKKVSLADLERFFEALLARGFNGGFMVIEIPTTQLFIQFSKYILKDGCIGLQFDFPAAPWSETYYERLKKELEKGGIRYTLEQTRTRQVGEFLTVDLKQDVSSASTLARIVLLSVFGFSEHSLVTVYFSNVSPREEMIAS